MNPLSNDVLSQPISRRTLFKLCGIGAVGGVVGYTRFSKPQPTVYQPDRLDLPRSLTQSKSVVVVGGGLAGLACAYELSQRGFAVTLLERSPQLGGKIASWQVEAAGETFMMEHGFHGFFPQYYNLKSIVAELEIQDNFRSLNSYAVLYRGEKYQPEVFRPSHSAFPWNIVDLAIASPNRLKWGINLTKWEHWQVFRAITGFQTQKTFQRLDRLSVAEWVERSFPQGLYDLYFLPFAKSSLNAPDLMSVGELMQFFHFYFFGNPEGLAFNGTRYDMGTSLVQPIAQAIEQNGGKIVTGAIVTAIQAQNGKISSLSYSQGEGEDTPFWVSGVGSRESVGAGLETRPYGSRDGFTQNLNSPADKSGKPALPEIDSGKNIEYYGAADRMYAVSPERKEAVSLTCTHQGCTVQLAEDGKFHCPCHGAVYDRQGKVLKGPAQKDLPRFQITQRQEDRLQLVSNVVETLHVTSLEPLKADYYVFATDVPGVQQLFTLVTGEVSQQVRSQVEKLSIADPFAVCRFWFDRDFDWQHSNFTSLSGYQLTDSITLYHRIQEPYIDWANKTGGSVVELHAYCYKEKEFPNQQALLTTFEQELYEIVPQLQQAKMLHRELVNQKNFSGYPPNSYSDRPETSTEIPNLIFAGDWVKMPFPCGLMERAVSSGLLAANEILHREGLQRRSLFSVNPEGMLKI
ncbi:MAG: Cytochrome b6-f complex iron-sulfur subunit [Chroococcidiopsis sp. SAG 2025]|uniref:FAD-dependent oxidoreductase n=1 Tax=Chroococcidiopsis sp. SAG 2025 TaxID=171389 RepID=UPI0029372B20|nr:FAD-dependent oxidoreductase [Chroococcidiopsis sp. SAG 2025]MDV2994261.1 Cytochrome b6-f complex iron-sulfur subunit [Chroococcidiopsis sp. SAG 2025]